MPSLAFFTQTSIPAQTENQAYGIKSVNEFLVSGMFAISAATKAYAVIKGTILLQQQTSDINKVNLILRPDNQKDLKLPIKYIIYRGLNISDFIESSDLSNPTNKVNTSGSELLAAMQVIQQGRAPGDDIPLEALFGNELSPASNKNIDEFFFKNLAPKSQLFTIECGTELGNFAVGDIGVEIILENPEFFVDVELAKEEKFEIKIESSMSSAEKKWRKDLVRHFVDPAAFYGLHYNVEDGIEYRNNSGNKQKAKTAELVFNEILEPFANTTRNTVYLDIRNENGYSYNYYDNYVGTSGPDADKELKIGQTSGGITPKEYYTDGWAVHIVDTIPGATDENEFFIALRVNDNKRPLIAGWNTELTPNSVVDPPLTDDTSSRVYFTDETILLPVPIPTTLPDFTNTIAVKTPNVPSESAQLATIVRLDYIKQLLPITASNKFPRINFTDYVFGPLDVNIPWDTDDVIEWVTTNHRTYIDTTSEGYVLGQYKTTILSIDLVTNEIEIFDEVPVELSKHVILEYVNGSPSTPYTPNKITFDNGKTKIEVNETITTALQTGDQLTLTVRLDGVLDYDNNKFIIRDTNCVNLEVLSNGNQLHFYSIEFLNTYDISSTVYNDPNTEVTFSNPKPKSGIAGFVETGILLEDDTFNTGSSDNDRILFYATPTNVYIDKANKKKSQFQKKGGALNKSFADALRTLLPDIEFEKTVLDIAPDPVSTFSLSSKKKAKEILFLLGLTRVEWDTAKAAITTTFHQKFFKFLSTTNSKTDGDGNRYYEYELQVAGEDTNGNFQVVNTGVKVYSIDRLVYVSSEFGKRFDIDTTLAGQILDDFINQTLYHNGKDFSIYNNPDLTPNPNPASTLEFYFSLEEWGNLSSDRFWIQYSGGNSNKSLFDKDVSMKTKIEEFKTALDNSNVKSKNKIKKVLREKGADLLKHTKAHIKGLNPNTGTPITPTPDFVNKDGILYLTRLIMSVIIRNHPKIRSKYGSKVQEFLDLFEKHSRGLEGTEKPTFSPQTTTHFNILISGYDPFGSAFPNRYYDWQDHQSNPSGNLALALDGEEVKASDFDNNGKKATIKSVIFPVRYREFDIKVNNKNEGWIEEFFKPYVDDSNVKMIITFSYGIDGDNYSFEIERFAARNRILGIPLTSTSVPDNNKKQAPRSPYLDKSDKDNHEFIETTLPFDDMYILDNVGLDQKAVFNYYEGNIDKGTSYLNNSSTTIIDRTTYPFGYSARFYNRDLKASYYSNIGSINLANYPPPLTVIADKIISEDGSGGSYLSNEIYYRVAFLRIKSSNPSKMTGHIHVGFLKNDPITSRTDMLNIIKASIGKAIDNFQL